jgi:catechol 2,3-dioxygenase-like lactoylglutathione lyase family enzyme
MRLNQVTVTTADLDAGIRFYQGMGLALIVRDDAAGYARLLCPQGDTTLSLHVGPREGGAHDVALYFECEELDRRVAELESAGYRFIAQTKDQPWLWREAWLQDPGGVALCLFHAGKNRVDPPWRLPS